MYIDHLKRGAGGILSHDEGYFGSEEGFCILQKWPRDHTCVCVCVCLCVYKGNFVCPSWLNICYVNAGHLHKQYIDVTRHHFICQSRPCLRTMAMYSLTMLFLFLVMAAIL